ncbi:MAG: YdcH family protein [Brevundimonas sp.]
MSTVLARRLQGFHALLEMALRDERSRPGGPDDRTVARIKKKKLAVKDRLAAFDDRPATTASR